MPGVRRACERYIEPNLPAPIEHDADGPLFRGPGFAAGGGGSYGRDLPTDGLAVYRPGDGQCIMSGMRHCRPRGPRPRGSSRLHRDWTCSACRRASSTASMRYRVRERALTWRMSGRPAANSSAAPPTRSSTARPATTGANHLHARPRRRDVSLQPAAALEGPGAGTLGARALLSAARRMPARSSASSWCWSTSRQLKDAEAALADRERQLSLIIDSVGFPITYVDRAPGDPLRQPAELRMVGAHADDDDRPVHPRRDDARGEDGGDAAHRARARRRAHHLRARGALAGTRDAPHPRPHDSGPRRCGAVLGVLIVLLDIEQDHQLRERSRQGAQLRTSRRTSRAHRRGRPRLPLRLRQQDVPGEPRPPLEQIVGRGDEVLGPQARPNSSQPYVER